MKITICALAILIISVHLANGATWETFQIAHVLNPNNLEGRNHASWNTAEWVMYLHDRDEDDKRERGGRNPVRLFAKGINSVVIASSDEILVSLANNPVPYKIQKHEFWSSRTFPIYNIRFIKNGNPPRHEVFKCPPMYFVAMVDDNHRPFHFVGSASTVEENYGGNLQVPYGECQKLD